MVDPIIVSAVAATFVTTLSAFSGLRDFFAKHRGKQSTSASVAGGQRASVLVEMPNGKQTKIEISPEEADRLLHQHLSTTTSTP